MGETLDPREQAALQDHLRNLMEMDMQAGMFPAAEAKKLAGLDPESLAPDEAEFLESLRLVADEVEAGAAEKAEQLEIGDTTEMPALRFDRPRAPQVEAMQTGQHDAIVPQSAEARSLAAAVQKLTEQAKSASGEAAVPAGQEHPTPDQLTPPDSTPPEKPKGFFSKLFRR